MSRCDFKAVSSDNGSSIVVCSRCGLRVAVPTEHAMLGIVYAECRIPGDTIVPQKAHGPGTELSKLLKRFGIEPTPTCACRAKAAEMDAWGCDEASKPERIDEVVAVMRAEAQARGLPFLDAVGRMLVRRAISNARRSA